MDLTFALTFEALTEMRLLEDCLFSLTNASKCLRCLSTLFLQNEKQQQREVGINEWYLGQGR